MPNVKVIGSSSCVTCVYAFVTKRKSENEGGEKKLTASLNFYIVALKWNTCDCLLCI